MNISRISIGISRAVGRSPFGPQLIGDPELGSSAGWVLGGNWNITGGILAHPAGIEGDAVYAISGLESGATYAIEIDIDAISGGVIVVELRGDTGDSEVISTPGAKSFDLIAGTNPVSFLIYAQSTTVIDISRFSDRKRNF